MRWHGSFIITIVFSGILEFFGLFQLVLGPCTFVVLVYALPEIPKSAATSLEWEDLDFYEILGLSLEQGADTSEIKKAYRREAKKWHPDKLLHYSGSGRNGNQTSFSQEEANRRFARIAEAYQVLSNNISRQEYDRFLSDQKYRQQRQKQNRNYRPGSAAPSPPPFPQESDNGSGSGGYFGFNFNFQWEDLLDPRRVFEEMFGFDNTASSKQNEDEYDIYDFLRNAAGTQDYESATNSHSFAASSSSSSLGDLIHVQERERILVDNFGREFLRIHRAEDYLQQDGNIYFRVLVRDFVEEWDPYTHSWVLIPLQQNPVLAEEGYRHQTFSPNYWSKNYRDNNNNNNGGSEMPSAQKKEHPSSETSQSIPLFHDKQRHFLFPGESLAVGEQLTRDNYMAGLTPECTLVVVRVEEEEEQQQNEDHGNFGKATTQTTLVRELWSSENLATGSGNCVLQLSDQGLLQVQLQGAGTGRPILLWSSDNDEDDDDNDDDDQEDNWNDGPPLLGGRPRSSKRPFRHIARLDSDGALSVYRIKRLPAWAMASLGLDDSVQDRLRLLRALQKVWQGLVRRALNLHTLDGQHGIPPEEEARFQCVYTTSPVGCFRPARLLWKHAQPVLRFLQSALRKLKLVLR